MPDPPRTQEQRPLIEGEDFYRDGPYVVFTEAYHRKRGYCCGSGCRHCPWREERTSADAGAETT
ncbi:MAG TPA: DUF5522 domain-containing protein [Acidobacteriaceae bacterium]|nr:DUF5522 domain-containing protein [Acidobacteriaceae bacterium]